MSTPVGIDLTGLTNKIISESQNESSELANEIDNIIMDAERLVNRDMDLQLNYVQYNSNFYYTGQVINGLTLNVGQTAYIYLPSDCLVLQKLTWFAPVGSEPATDGSDQLLGVATVLQEDDQGIMDFYWPNKSLVAPPVYYYLSGQQPILGTSTNLNPNNGIIRVAPTPDMPYAYTMYYATQQSSLVTLGPGNYTYISTWYPDVLFYACMMRTGQFIKNFDETQMWTAMYQQAVKESKIEEIRKKGDDYKLVSDTVEPLPVRNR